MDFILIQLVGAIAYGTLAISYFKKEKKKILFMQIIAYIMFTLHYFLLSGVTGAICNLIGLLAMITIYIFDKYKWKHKNYASAVFILLLIIINIITFQNVYSIFPLIASVIAVMSFLSEKEDFIRAIGVIAAICWLIYGIVYGSYIGIAFEVVTLIGVIGAFIKNSRNAKVEILEKKEK